jgi:MFS family permease
MFWVSFPFGILSFVLPIYGREIGATALQVGVFFSALAIVPVVVRPFLGRALDRWGRRPFLLLGLLGYAGAMVLFILANRVWLLTLARFVQGLGQAFLWLSAVTIVADVAAAMGRGRDFGLIDEASNRGAILGTVLGFSAVLIAQQGGKLDWIRLWPWLFIAYTIPALLALTIAWLRVPETRPPPPEGNARGQPISRQLLALMGIVLITGASTNMVWPLLMILLQDTIHANVMELARAYLPAAIISSVLPSRLGYLADRFGRKLLMAAGLLIGAAASILIPQLRSLIALVILWAVESIGYAASAPAERAFVADITGDDARGTSYGLYTFAYFLGAAIGPVVGGWLYDNVAPAMPFYLNGAALALGAGLVWAFLREACPRDGCPAGRTGRGGPNTGA